MTLRIVRDLTAEGRPPTAGELIDAGREDDVQAIAHACDAWYVRADEWARRANPHQAGVATIAAIDLVDLLRRARIREMARREKRPA